MGSAQTVNWLELGFGLYSGKYREARGKEREKDCDLSWDGGVTAKRWKDKERVAPHEEKQREQMASNEERMT